jgi:hypothetical protein
MATLDLKEVFEIAVIHEIYLGIAICDSEVVLTAGST